MHLIAKIWKYKRGVIVNDIVIETICYNIYSKISFYELTYEQKNVRKKMQQNNDSHYLCKFEFRFFSFCLSVYSVFQNHYVLLYIIF